MVRLPIAKAISQRAMVRLPIAAAISRSGQAVIEYVVIFIAITLLAGGFISRAKGVFEGHFNNAVSRILN